MLLDLLLLVLICVASFLVRAYPRLKLPNAICSDSYYHLKCAKDIRHNSWRIPRTIKQSILPHEYNYPFGYHFFLASFGEKTRPIIERYTSAFFDTLNVIIVFVASHYLWPPDPSSHFPTASVIAALFAFSPALLRVASGPRAYNGSPRVPGQTLYLIHILSAWGAGVTHSPILLLTSVVGGALLICTAKFGSQAFVFFGVFFAAAMDGRYLFLMSACLLTAILLTKGHAWKIFISQIKYSILYAKHLQRPFLFPRIIRFPAYHKCLRQALTHWFREGRFRNFFDWYRREPYFLHLMWTVFPHFLAIPFLLLISKPIHTGSLFMIVWFSAGLFWFILTRMKYLLFLGEAERYLEYALFPSYFLFVRLLPSPWTLLLPIYFLYSVWLAIYYIRDFMVRNRPLHDDYESSERLFELMNGLPEGVVLPVGWVHHQILHRSHFPVVSLAGNADPKLFPIEDYIFLFSNYPYPPLDFQRLIERYQPLYIVAERTCLNHYLRMSPTLEKLFYEHVTPLAESPMLLLFATNVCIRRMWDSVERSRATQNFQEARRQVDQLISIFPKNPDLLCTKGDLELKLGHAQEAFDIFECSLKDKPHDIPILLGMAKASLQLGAPQKAEGLVKKVLRLQPKQAEALVLNQQILAMPNRSRNLLKSINECQRGLQVLAAGQPAEAMELFDSVLSDASSIMGIHMGRALCLLRLDRLAEAEEELRFELRLHPNHQIARECFRSIRTQEFTLTEGDSRNASSTVEFWGCRLSFPSS